MTDPRGNTTAFVYDAGNRLTRTIAPDATFRTTGYDALGRRISETDESGKITRFGYDALGKTDDRHRRPEPGHQLRLRRGRQPDLADGRQRAHHQI